MSSHSDQPAQALEISKASSSPTPKMYSPIFENHSDFYAHLCPKSQQKLTEQLQHVALTASQEVFFRPKNKNLKKTFDEAELDNNTDSSSYEVPVKSGADHAQDLALEKESDEHSFGSFLDLESDSDEGVLVDWPEDFNHSAGQEEEEQDHDNDNDNDVPPASLLIELARSLSPAEESFFRQLNKGSKESLTESIPSLNSDFENNNDHHPLSRAVSDLRLLDKQYEKETLVGGGGDPFPENKSVPPRDQECSVALFVKPPRNRRSTRPILLQTSTSEPDLNEAKFKAMMEEEDENGKTVGDRLRRRFQWDISTGRINESCKCDWEIAFPT